MKRSIAFCSAALLALAGCSHLSPYYRPDVLPASFPAGDDLRQRVLLIGDAGAPQKDEPVLKTLEHWAGLKPQKTTVVFLGDNVYEGGILEPDHPDYQKSVEYLQAQVDVAKNSGARALFIPGNHDWGKGGEQGRAGLARQEALIRQQLPASGSFLPPAGCPGPAALDLDGVRLIVLDTQWWLQKKRVSPGQCACQDSAAVLAELEGLLSSAGDRKVFVLAHHPLASHGPHGGFFDWRDHLFPARRWRSFLWVPLPLAGSLYPLVRSCRPPDQDLASPAYRSMTDALKRVLSRHRPLIYAAGHDHALQVLEGHASVGYTLVSGLGSAVKATAVSHGDDTLFAHLHPGFMAIDLMENGRVLLRVVEPGTTGAVFALWLNEAD